MGTAFVLMKTEAGRDREVYLALTQLPEVIEVHALYGEYDLLAMIEAESTTHLTSILIERFRLVEGVKTTQTLIAVDY
ncbi:MAG: AsnC family transcriptional regulator [Euryarchaeota archaeon]|nr:AsnC family transcriptional regulator [Euryarchaeota archaeon]